MCNRALRRLGYLQRTLLSAPLSTRLFTYKTLVRPILEYASVIWNHTKYLISRKLNLSRRKLYASIIVALTDIFHPVPIFLVFNLPVSLSVESLKFLYTLINSPRFPLLSKYIAPAKPTTTRHHHELNMTTFHHRTDAFKYTFFVRSIELWNALPGYARSLPLDEFLLYITNH